LDGKKEGRVVGLPTGFVLGLPVGLLYSRREGRAVGFRVGLFARELGVADRLTTGFAVSGAVGFVNGRVDGDFDARDPDKGAPDGTVLDVGNCRDLKRSFAVNNAEGRNALRLGHT